MDVALFDGASIRPRHQVRRGFQRANRPETQSRTYLKRLAVDLEGALDGREFELEFQPIVDCVSERITSFEALLRWNHPVFGRVGPSVFIPIAEDLSLMSQIGEWVLRQACDECSGWPEQINVSVNLSASQLRDCEAPRVLADAMASVGLSPSRVELELTETFLLAEEGALQTLNRMRASGVRVLLDDFGTGYSSLSYLHRFPFDKVKIDREFVQTTDKCPHSYRMIEAMMRFASVLGIPTIIEGVETAQQLARIRALGPCEIQGYYYGRPMKGQAVSKLISGGFRLRGGTSYDTSVSD